MGLVINKTTLEMRDSVNVPDYDPAEWLINPDLTPVWSLSKEYWKVAGNELIPKSPEEIAAIDAAKLEVRRKDWLAKVDAEAERRITAGPGMEYPDGSGVYVSASINAQIKWLGFYALADEWVDMGLTFPFPVRTKNDLNYVLVNDAAEIKIIFKKLALFVAAGIGAVEGTKYAIQHATTAAEMEELATAYIGS